MISVPESVGFYWDDPVNRAALDVLAGGVEVPGDLSLPEAERFEVAALAARRVRVEFWAMLRALWAATWGEAVRAHLPGAQLLSYGEHGRFVRIDPLADPSMSAAWTNKAAGGVFALPGAGHLFTRVALLDGERAGELQFYHWENESCAVSSGLDLGADWTDDGSERRTTRAGVLPVAAAAGHLDPAPFATLALAAMSVLAAAV